MKKSKTQNIYKVIMLVFLTAIITFLVTTIYMYNKLGNAYSLSDLTSSVSEEDGSEKNLIKTLKEFNTLLSNSYIGVMNKDNMIEGAIKGYVDGIGDPYTQYLTAEEMSELTEETSGKYVGIGVYVTNDTQNNTILVVGIIDDSPALDVGIQAGDIIEKINGIKYTGEQLNEATSILKGEAGTDVTVTILRDDEEKELKITRRTITVKHVGSIMVDDYGYIQIDSFDDGVADDFETAFNKLKEQQMKGLIIDLRNNGGGVVDEATKIASMFTKKGETILITKDKNEKEEKTYSDRDPIVKDLPVVVLINEATASASEILAGALRDNYGAKIVGKNSYGKGVIQTVYKLTDGSGLKITTNSYYTPKYTAINAVGIKPDVEVELQTTTSEDDTDTQLKKAMEVLAEEIK